MVYIRLFHGRTDPGQDMDDWGSDGPVFGPYLFSHTTYGWDIKLGKSNGNCDELYVHEDMVYYDGVYYGDWSIFNATILEKSKLKTTIFAPNKAKLPEKSCS
ncbi:MAG: hypothetical protein FJ263_03755 [Planctomycetes bacterium]|nr:hypothetical protein [Planctomycetota bacterium]